MTVKIELSYSDKLDIARMVLDLQKQERGSEAVQVAPDYVPTKRLTVAEACKHLGVSRTTLYARVKSGEVEQRFSQSGKPYFLLGELDGVKVRNVNV